MGRPAQPRPTKESVARAGSARSVNLGAVTCGRSSCSGSVARVGSARWVNLGAVASGRSPRFGAVARARSAGRSSSEPLPVRLSPTPPMRASFGRGAVSTLRSEGEHDWDDPPSLIVPAQSVVPMVDEPTRGRADRHARTGGRGARHRPRRREQRAALQRHRRSAAPSHAPGPRHQRHRAAHRGRTQQGFDDTLETNRPTVARPTRNLEGMARGRMPSDELPGQKRPTPTPANGRRRAEAESSRMGEIRPPVAHPRRRRPRRR